MVSEVLDEAVWPRRRDRHRDRVSAVLGAYLDQRADGAADPVIDFLFRYYTLRPVQLVRWHPGFGVALTGPAAAAYARLSGYRRSGHTVTVDPELLRRRRATIDFVVALLSATAGRRAHLGCFGLHEWAMVYRAEPGDVRHSGVPLRLGIAGTNAVVESMPLRCTHFDAFRFFTDPARPRNCAQLTREAQPATEQPGCLHAAMDLYKWAAKLLPLLDSDIVMDAFELAYAARVLDMRASPYDLTALGYEPVRIETPSGRVEYVRRQAVVAERAAVVRQTLLARCRGLLGAGV
ncbi:MAG: 3-methyladenine DNA glycosylase [Mycobacteriaceae bacterium]|nr:3-methyladenine DNA glycosylase [Mycobacteriaceae bacterium]